MSLTLTYTPIHSPCVDGYYQGTLLFNMTRGITTWNLNNQFTLPNNGLIPPNREATIVFTNTMPKCYSPPGRDTSNLLFYAQSTGASSGTVNLTTRLNGSAYMTMGLSGVAYRGATIAFEYGGTCNQAPYYDPGENTFVFRNPSTNSTTIQITQLKMYRTYKMCNTNAVLGDNCPACAGSSVICSGGHPYYPNGDFDLQRFDIPCNRTNCGGLSYTNWGHDTVHANEIIQPNNTLSWTFNFDIYSHGWQGKSICLFNFNNVSPTETDTITTHDVKLKLLLNGNSITTYYLNRWKDQALSLSYDLAQSNCYNDTTANTVTLENLGTVPVRVSPDPFGGIDIYRFYRSSSICDSPCYAGETECPSCECGCQTTCDASCQLSCMLCLACYSCYVGCQEGCEVECQNCQSACELSCQNCQNCQTGCEVSCQDCQVCVSCQTSESCPSGYYECQSCETCQPCYSCQTACELTCQNCQTGCEVSCQDCQTCVSCQTLEYCPGGYYECQSCETCQPCYSCQTACELTCQNCQTGCEVSCQDCQTCVSCQTLEYCPGGYYECQSCETCQPAYT